MDLRSLLQLLPALAQKSSFGTKAMSINRCLFWSRVFLITLASARSSICQSLGRFSTFNAKNCVVHRDSRFFSFNFFSDVDDCVRHSALICSWNNPSTIFHALSIEGYDYLGRGQQRINRLTLPLLIGPPDLLAAPPCSALLFSPSLTHIHTHAHITSPLCFSVIVVISVCYCGSACNIAL